MHNAISSLPSGMKTSPRPICLFSSLSRPYTTLPRPTFSLLFARAGTGNRYYPCVTRQSIATRPSEFYRIVQLKQEAVVPGRERGTRKIRSSPRKRHFRLKNHSIEKRRVEGRKNIIIILIQYLLCDDSLIYKKKKKKRKENSNPL